ncbi:MAG: MBOAT family protein [Atopobiaceae bacterium]|nr:MBOAT family protein [Atopobiaceae bacterium]
MISVQVALFLLVSLFAYYGVGRVAPHAQWWVLLASNLVFYVLAAGWTPLVFLLAASAVTWLFARRIEALEDESKAARKGVKDKKERSAIRARFDARRRSILWLGIALCLGCLFILKYLPPILVRFGIVESASELGWLLPLGISFYMLQALSYLIDVYNSKYASEPDFVRYFTFVAWFPQLTQGPINRYAELAPQLFAPHDSGEHIERGLVRLGYGLFKKLAIANVLAPTISAIVAMLSGTDPVPGSVALHGVILYSFQMYADFSGGIDIVEGVAEMFGIEMAPNFELPYFSTSLAVFWRRWHMSLGAWMRDYVFYPLALTKPMQRFGKWLTGRAGRHIGRTLPIGIANIVVFVLVGLWHGADLHYLVWGFYNGAVIALSDLLAPAFDAGLERAHIQRDSRGWTLFSILRTFAVVNIGRFFDFIPSTKAGLLALLSVFTRFDAAGFLPALEAGGVPIADWAGFPAICILACAMLLVISVLYANGHDVRAEILEKPFILRLAIYTVFAAVIMVSLTFNPYDQGNFVYANF